MAEGMVYLLGGGGHGSVVLDALLSSGVAVKGIVDPGMARGESVFGVPVVGGDEWLAALAPEKVLLVNGVGVVPGSQRRRELYRTWKDRAYRFALVCHSSAVLGHDVALGPGSQVMAGAVLQCRVTVGENTVINTRASIDHDCRIGSHAFVGPGVTLCGSVEVGEDAFIGAGAVLLPGIAIGKGAIVGAGAVVTRAVPEGAVVAGNPAVRKKRENL